MDRREGAGEPGTPAWAGGERFHRLDAVPGGAVHERGNLLDQPVQLEGSLAGEGGLGEVDQGLHHVPPAQAGLADALVGLPVRGAGHDLLAQGGGAHDDGQGVVDIVGDPRHQDPERFELEARVAALQFLGAPGDEAFEVLLVVPELPLRLHPGHHVAEQAPQGQQDLQILLGVGLGSGLPDDGQGGGAAVPGERQEGQRKGRLGQRLGTQEAGLQHRPGLVPGLGQDSRGRDPRGEGVDQSRFAVLAGPDDQHQIAPEEVLQGLGQLGPGVLLGGKVAQILGGVQHGRQALGGGGHGHWFSMGARNRLRT
jgi:hypothetical protein